MSLENIKEKGSIILRNFGGETFAVSSGILFVSGRNYEAIVTGVAGVTWGVLNSVRRYRIAREYYILPEPQTPLGIHPFLDNVEMILSRLTLDAEKPESRFIVDLITETAVKIFSFGAFNYTLSFGVLSGAWQVMNTAFDIRQKPLMYIVTDLKK